MPHRKDKTQPSSLLDTFASQTVIKTSLSVRFGKRSGSDTSAIPGYLVGDDYFLPVSSEN